MLASLAIFAILAADPVVPSAPEQGIIIVPPGKDIEATFATKGKPDAVCRITRAGDACYFPLPPGKAELLVDRRPMELSVPKGLSRVVFYREGWGLAIAGLTTMVAIGFGGPTFLVGMVAVLTGATAVIIAIVGGTIGAVMALIDVLRPHERFSAPQPVAPEPEAGSPPPNPSEPPLVPAS